MSNFLLNGDDMSRGNNDATNFFNSSKFGGAGKTNNSPFNNAAFNNASLSSYDTSISRVPPHSILAEESILGAILLDNEAFNVAIEIINADDFYRPAHAITFQAMVQLVDKRAPIDVITLADTLKSLKSLDEVGGFDYLARLSSSVPSSANVSYYARIVHSLSLRRRIIHEASEIIDEAFAQEGEIEEVLDGVEARILSLSNTHRHSEILPVGDIIQDSIRQIEKLLDRKELVTGTPSGFTDLDRLTAGMQPSDLIIIAARPSMGKTSFALGMGANAALRNNKGVAVFSLEMSREQLVLRLLCSLAEVDNSRVRTGHLGPKDFPNLIAAANEIAESQLYIDDTPALTPTELRAKCRRLHRTNPLGMIIVDYLQLMRSPAHAKAREQEIAYISRSLKGLAKELHVPIVALSQLNRSVEGRNDKRPMMSDLRESGAIEQDADVIMFIYRDEVYNEDSPDKGTAEIIISKQRNGPTGMIKLAFSASHTRFDNLAYDDELPDYLATTNNFDHTKNDKSTNKMNFASTQIDNALVVNDLYTVDSDINLSDEEDPYF